METELINEGGFNYIENGNGRPIIILHGLMGGLSNFKGVYDYFPSVKHKVIIPELPVDSTPILKTNVATFSKFVFEFIEVRIRRHNYPVKKSGGSSYLSCKVSSIFDISFSAELNNWSALN